MNRQTRTIEQHPGRNNELELACRLWIAAGQAKDERIRELEAECARLRQRVSRLSRMMSKGEGQKRLGKVSCGQ